MKRFLWDHAIPQQVHTPSSFGPAVILKTTDTWVSSLKWPGYCNSWNTQVIRAELAQKVTTKSADNQSVQIHFHMFCVHCLWEIRVLISRSSEGSSLIFVTCLGRSGQVTIPWLKWLTDALASEPILQIWPRGFSVKPGRVRWRPWKIIMAREDSWMYLLSISFGSKCHSLAKVWDPWLTLLSLAWKPHYCWLCNQLFIIKSNLM